MADVQEDEFTFALKKTVISALHRGNLAKGLHETCKAIEAKKVEFVVLADNCDEQSLTKLIHALCKENDVGLIKINEGETLGEWIGICKTDSSQKIRKKRKCSVLALKEFPVDIQEDEREMIKKHVVA